MTFVCYDGRETDWRNLIDGEQDCAGAEDEVESDRGKKQFNMGGLL